MAPLKFCVSMNVFAVNTGEKELTNSSPESSISLSGYIHFSVSRKVKTVWLVLFDLPEAVPGRMYIRQASSQRPDHRKHLSEICKHPAFTTKSSIWFVCPGKEKLQMVLFPYVDKYNGLKIADWMLTLFQTLGMTFVNIFTYLMWKWTMFILLMRTLRLRHPAQATPTHCAARIWILESMLFISQSECFSLIPFTCTWCIPLVETFHNELSLFI
jgi:hypothetical protein